MMSVYRGDLSRQHLSKMPSSRAPVQAEELLDNLQMNCEHCDEVVLYGDDYRDHLIFNHGVKRNFAYFMKKQEEKIKNEKRKVEVIDIDDDEEEEEEKLIEDEVEDNEDIRRELQEAYSIAMEKILRPFYDIIEEKVDVSLASRQTGDVDEADEDEEVLKGLDDLPAVLGNIQFSDENLRDILGENSHSRTEAAPPAARDSAKPPKLVRPSERRRAPETGAPSGAPTPPSPSTSTSSSGSVSSYVFLCPLDDCKFFTTKDGMTNTTAANHLKAVHQVTGKMMQNAPKDKYKFRKVKREHS